MHYFSFAKLPQGVHLYNVGAEASREEFTYDITTVEAIAAGSIQPAFSTENDIALQVL